MAKRFKMSQPAQNAVIYALDEVSASVDLLAERCKILMNRGTILQEQVTREVKSLHAALTEVLASCKHVQGRARVLRGSASFLVIINNELYKVDQECTGNYYRDWQQAFNTDGGRLPNHVNYAELRAIRAAQERRKEDIELTLLGEDRLGNKKITPTVPAYDFEDGGVLVSTAAFADKSADAQGGGQG